MDVVSLLPSATEICYALGIEPVGVSHECDHPPAAAKSPTMTYSVVDGEGSSAEVDAAVAEAEREGNGVYAIDREALAAADPDLVLTQGVCDVCAVDRVLVRDAVEDLGLDADVLTLDTHSLAGLYDDVQRIGDWTGRRDRADGLVDELRARVDRVRERTRTVQRRPRVAVLDWMDPVMVAGHWMPELVEVASGRYGLEESEERSRPREWSEVREYDPDVIVVAPCGFGLEQTSRHLSELSDRPGWGDVTAVERDRAYLMDGHHYVNRSGPRLVDTLEHVAGLVQPREFDAPPADVVRPATRTGADAE